MNPVPPMTKDGPFSFLPYAARRPHRARIGSTGAYQKSGALGGPSVSFLTTRCQQVTAILTRHQRRRDRWLQFTSTPKASDWTSGVPFYGPGCLYEGKDLVRLRILSDRRQEGGGISWIARFLPPPGRHIKIVAVALSDEHIFNFEGGRATKSGQPGEAIRRLWPQHERPAA